MARHKSEEFKDFIISERKKVGSGLTNAPVWLMQKAGKRLWSTKQKRSWKTIDMKKKYFEEKQKQNRRNKKSGDHKKHSKMVPEKVEK
ncbi:MAG: hypothetical protein NTY48_00210 [Candidatus Diapherotrites archaeon]|nr:hypothetical protein [Candidatus Diapherotrites archaeon]